MTQSPFDKNGRQWAWDTISLTWLEDCPQKYMRFMLEGWRPKSISVDLEFGLLYAAAHRQYHTLILTESHDDALREVVRSAMVNSWPWPFEDPIKSRENLIRTIVWYFDVKFKDDPCKTVILADGSPAVELSATVQIDENNVFINHVDRIVEFVGRNFIQDQKTTRNSVGSFYFNRYSPDLQMSKYTVAGRIAFRIPTEGVMLDVAQIQVGGTQFKRGFVYRTIEQLEEWIEHQVFWVGPYRDAAEAADWPMNPTSCNKFGDAYGNKDGGCPLRKVCSADPRIRQSILESDFEKKPWNPLEERK